MNIGNVVGEEFEPYVLDQIDIRQSLNGGGSVGSEVKRTDNSKLLNYLNNRNTWVKMASSVNIIKENDTKEIIDGVLKTTKKGFNGLKRLKDISTDLGDTTSTIAYDKYQGQGLAKNFVLFNTMQNLNFENETTQAFGSYTTRSGIQQSQQSWIDVDHSYGLGGTAMGLQPTPGIIDVSIDCVNRGSIRKATVTLKAFNTFQFSVIEMLYLRLGYTMMLEWGWDKYVDSLNQDGTFTTKDMEETIIEKHWFKNTTLSHTNLLLEIEEQRELHQGNYDGFFGKVNNFTWNFNPDGSYDITINLVTVGDVVESLKVNLPADIPTDAYTQQQQQELTEDGKITKESALYQSLGNDILIRHLSHLVIKYIRGNKDIKESKDKLNYNADESLFNITPTLAEIGVGNPLQGKSYYITLGDFLDIVQRLAIPRSKKDEYIIKINTLPDYNFIRAFQNQIPLDPGVCIFTSIMGKNTLESYRNLDPTNITGDLVYNALNNNLNSEFAVTEKNFVAGKLMNIYLNIDFIIKIIQNNKDENGDLSLFGLVESICVGLNKSLGGINNLEPILKKDKELVIIDQNPIPGIEHFTKQPQLKKDKDFPFLEVYGFNRGKSNFLKDIKFQTKIDNSLASMISIGATGDGTSTKNYDATAFSKWNIGLKDRFALEFDEPTQTTETGRDISQNSQLIKDARAYAKSQIYNRNINGNVVKYWKVTPSGKWIPQGAGDGRLNLIKAAPRTRKPDNTFKTTYIKPNDAIEIWVDRYKNYISSVDRRTYTDQKINEVINNTYIGHLHKILGQQFEFGLGNGENGSNESINPTPKTYLDLFRNSSLVERGLTLFKSYIISASNRQFKNVKEASGNIGFIPLSFDLTLEGLSGVKIYNKLNLDTRFLPPNYGKSLDFLITKVNHKISNNSWDTMLGTISTSNLSENKPLEIASSFTGDLVKPKVTVFTNNVKGTTQIKAGSSTIENGRLDNSDLVSIKNPSKYKGNIQSDNGNIRLLKPAAEALDRLLAKADKDGITFKINSAYRSISDQSTIFEAVCSNKAFDKLGKPQKCVPKDKERGGAAAVGYTQHGFGLAVDFANGNFGKIGPNSPQYKWLTQNAEEFSFRRINPGSKRTEEWESWHWEFQIQTYNSNKEEEEARRTLQRLSTTRSFQ